jgi:hypothetical protein
VPNEVLINLFINFTISPSALKAALGDDASSNNNNWSGWEMFDLVPPTLDAFAQNSGGRNPLDRYTSGLLLQLKLKFFIQMKDCIIISNKSATKNAEGQEKEDIDGTPTPAAADETHELPIRFGINDLIPSDSEQQEQREKNMKSKHKEVKEETESEFKRVLNGCNVSAEKKADFLARFRSLLKRRLDKLLRKADQKSKPTQEGTTRKRARLNREEEDEGLNCDKEKSPAVAEAGRDDYIKGEMNRLVRKYEDLMKKYLASCSEVPISSSSSGASSRMPPPPPPVDPIPPTVSIAIHLGWNHTHVGWMPPNKTSVGLLFPPIPSLIGFDYDDDESQVLYGNQVYEVLGKNSRYRRRQMQRSAIECSPLPISESCSLTKKWSGGRARPASSQSFLSPCSSSTSRRRLKLPYHSHHHPRTTRSLWYFLRFSQLSSAVGFMTL